MDCSFTTVFKSQLRVELELPHLQITAAKFKLLAREKERTQLT